MASYIGRVVVFIVALFSFGDSGWLPIDSITNRQNKNDITCNNNARSVVADPMGNIHIIWRGQAPDTLQVWYSFWDAQTREWAQDTVISTDHNRVGDPAIACDSSGNIYVAWITSGVLKLKRRDAVSNEWLPAESLIGSSYDSAVAVAIDRNGVQHLTWVRLFNSNAPILYIAHDTSWSRIETVSVIAQPQIHLPSITSTPDGDLMVVWHENFIVLARRRISGLWRDIDTVYNWRDGRWPCVCWSPDSFYVVWVVLASVSHQSIMYRARGAEGWGDTVKLCPDYRLKTGPSIASDLAGNLFVTWAGYDSSSPDYSQIYYSYRARGQQWTRRDTLTSGQGNRLRVSASAGFGTMQVAWSELVGTPTVSAVRLRRYERIHDVGVMRIEQPRDTIDSASIVCPVALVKNYGDFPEFSVKTYFQIGDSVRFEEIESLAAGESTMVVFDSLSISWRDLTVFACSVSVFGDVNQRNDILRGSIFVRVQDVMLEEILAPVGRIGAGFIRPRVKVQNCGNIPARLVACCSIFTLSQQILVHKDMVPLTLGVGVSQDTGFRGWNAEPDSYLMRVRVLLLGDMHPENDTASEIFWVLNRDVGVSKIIWPVGVADSGDAGHPQAIIKNYGETAESVKVRLRIGGGYNDSNTIWLQPGDSAIDTFNVWQALLRGYNVVRCSTMLAGDRVPGNNRAIETLFVRVCDAGVDTIINPGEIISRGEIEPEVIIGNFGNESADIAVYFKIQDSSGREAYLDSVKVRIAPAVDSLIRFPPWQALSGNYLAISWTCLDGDMQPENDTIRKPFRVARRDVAIREIVAPVDTIFEGVIEPVVSLVNLGEELAQFYAFLTIFLLPDTTGNYCDSAFVTLESGETRSIQFGQWLALPGRYLIRGKTALWGDENPANDSVSSVFYVESLSNRRWQELFSIPKGTRNRPVRAGGCLASSERAIYALKGGGCAEFWRYEPASGNWSELAPMPSGQSGKKPKAGAAMCWDGEGRIYALKGRNTREFLVYDISGDSWIALLGLPEYTRGVRFGSGLVFVGEKDTGKVFCLKGSGTNDFLVYWVNQREWHSRRPVPEGIFGKPVKRGSALVQVGERLFCLKGGTNEFYEYLPQKDSWRICAILPFGRGFKKSREGAALVSDGSQYIYAFKGGRTNEFWRYDVLLDSWEPLEDIPLGARWRRVGPGGALTFCDGKVFALKGGGSREFWSYKPGETDNNLSANIRGWEGQRSGVDAKGQSQVSTFKRLIIYDVSGRIRRNERVEPGVYFIIEERALSGSKVKKLVVYKRGLK